MIARLARIFTLATAALAAPAWAAPAMVDPATLDVSNSGDTAFMLICGALLMLFAVPGVLLMQAGRGTARAYLRKHFARRTFRVGRG